MMAHAIGVLSHSPLTDAFAIANLCGARERVALLTSHGRHGGLPLRGMDLRRRCSRRALDPNYFFQMSPSSSASQRVVVTFGCV